MVAQLVKEVLDLFGGQNYNSGFGHHIGEVIENIVDPFEGFVKSC